MSTVLIVEDSATEALQFAGMLRSAGFRVERAPSLESGIRRIQLGGIDALLLDLTLPDSEGLQTVLTARAQAPNTPVVILTSLDDESVAAAALQQGAQDYLVKSEVNRNWLVRAVQNALARTTPYKSEAVASLVVEPRAQHIVQVSEVGPISLVRVPESRLRCTDDVNLFSEKLTGVIDAGCRKLVINLTGVDYLSNSALGVLLTVRRKMLQAGGEIRLTNLHPSIQEQLACRQFDKLFDLCEDEKAALKNFATRKERSGE
jgi:anti-anti-sigma factor